MFLTTANRDCQEDEIRRLTLRWMKYFPCISPESQFTLA